MANRGTSVDGGWKLVSFGLCVFSGSFGVRSIVLCKCSGKYIDIYFNLKITYPLVPYPHTYIARFAPFTQDGGMCHKS